MDEHEPDPVARSSFLNELHAQFELPPPVVVGLVERATRGTVIDMTRVVRGDEGEVYRVRLADGASVYPRILRPGVTGIRWEVWAMEKARQAGLPVPVALTVERVYTDQGEREAVVTAAATGNQLISLLPTMSASERRNVMTEVGRVLARLHTVHTPGPWRPDDTGRWPNSAERRDAYVAEIVERRAQLTAAGVGGDEVDRAVQLLEASLDMLVPADPVLCHGDVYSEHIFIDDAGRVSGLIDWGLWQGAAAAADLAPIAILHGRSDLDAVVLGYEACSLSNPTFRNEIEVAVLDRVTGDIAWHSMVGDTSNMESMVTALRQTLAALETES